MHRTLGGTLATKIDVFKIILAPNTLSIYIAHITVYLIPFSLYFITNFSFFLQYPYNTLIYWSNPVSSININFVPCII